MKVSGSLSPHCQELVLPSKLFPNICVLLPKLEFMFNLLRFVQLSFSSYIIKDYNFHDTRLMLPKSHALIVGKKLSNRELAHLII